MNSTWQAACGGTETPFTHNGVRYLYVWDGTRHGYLNMDTDIVVADYRTGEIISYAPASALARTITRA